MDAPLNQPLRGVVEHSDLIESIPSKIYFISYVGRSEPEKYEWGFAQVTMRSVNDGIERLLHDSQHHGVPHMTISFPHVTRVYRWGDPHLGHERETNVYPVGLARTETMQWINSAEIGCPGELYVLGKELELRGVSETLADYLSRFISIGAVIPITNPNMVRDALIK